MGNGGEQRRSGTAGVGLQSGSGGFLTQAGPFDSHRQLPSERLQHRLFGPADAAGRCAAHLDPADCGPVGHQWNGRHVTADGSGGCPFQLVALCIQNHDLATAQSVEPAQ